MQENCMEKRDKTRVNSLKLMHQRLKDWLLADKVFVPIIQINTNQVDKDISNNQEILQNSTLITMYKIQALISNLFRCNIKF